jgi:DNA-binding IclR family transcriptional regulator
MKESREEDNVQAFGAAIEVKTVVKQVANAIAILRYLANGRSSTATAAARELKINTSTCFNILRTLAGETIVAFDQVAKTYKIGPGMLQFVSTVMSEDNRLLAAKPSLQEFAKKHHATICVWRRASAWRNVLVAVEYSDAPLRIHLPIGQSFPVLLGSTGRVMISHLGLTKKEAKAEFRKLRWFRAPDFEEFWADAQQAPRTGWAVDYANFSPGVTTVSVPIINASGGVNYSVTALFFKDQHSKTAAVTVIGKALKELAQALTAILY